MKQYILEFKEKNYANFKSFYDLTQKSIYLTAVAILKDSEQSLDIVQDTYLKFLENINNIDENRFHEGYLTRIARNLSINVYNRDKKKVISEELINNIQTEDKDIYQDAELKGILDLLDDELLREIVVYHIILEYKFKDTANIINKPLGTTLWLYNKAVKQLKERMKV